MADPDAVAHASIALKHFVAPLGTHTQRKPFALERFPGLAPPPVDDDSPANGSSSAKPHSGNGEAGPAGSEASRGDRLSSLGSRRPSDATTSSRGSDSDTATSSLPPLPELPPPHLRHSSRARVTPLTQLPQRLHPAAAMLSRNLLAAMGDRKLSFPDRLASTVRACALASPGYDDS